MIKNKKRIHFIVNSYSGNFDAHYLEKTIGLLLKKKFILNVERSYPTCAGSAIEKASKIVADIIVPVGGDGTFRLVMQGLLLNKNLQAIDAIILLPMGTVNLIAKELGLKNNAHSFVELIANYNKKVFYYGKCRHEIFFCMAGYGADAAVVHNVNLNLKRKLGKIAYLYSFFQYLLRSTPDTIQMDVDGRLYTVTSAIVCNSKYYGGKFKLTPNSSLFDSELQVCLINAPNKLSLLRAIGTILIKTRKRRNYIKFVTAKEVNIQSTSGLFQIDGDPFEKGEQNSISITEFPVPILVK